MRGPGAGRGAPGTALDGGAPGAPGADRLAIRPATTADLETAVRLRIALLREHGDNAVYGRLRADAPERARILFAAQLASRGEVLFLAERAGEAIGCLRCVESQGSPLLHPARYGYLSSAYVVPHERRRGVLQALLAAAEEWCHARGLTELRLHNASDHADASGAWEALGFEVVELLRVRRLER